MASSATSIEAPPKFHVLVAADDTSSARKAVNFAAKLCQRTNNATLNVVHAIGLNPNTSSFMGALDRTNNLEIRHESQATVESLRKLLSSYDGIVNYHLNTVEQQLPVAEILEKLVNRDPPDLLVLGSNNREGLQKFVLGSVSEHCLHRCKCPVTIVKDI
ncbi:hypothetical protein VTP01DRAFT_79 [Rhizomucor pusillus]|uniref:uncharacterized protein n=1 Tax=Rhizomucor pusillus TaxID=4840 RepID=UPI0037446E3E